MWIRRDIDIKTQQVPAVFKWKLPNRLTPLTMPNVDRDSYSKVFGRVDFEKRQGYRPAGIGNHRQRKYERNFVIDT